MNSERIAATDDREGGFTLVELIMTMAILGIILGGISAILLTSLKSQSTDRKLLDAAIAEQQLAYWLPADMQSFGGGAGDINVTASNGNTDCSGVLAGGRVLHLAWTDTAGATAKSYSADYTIETIDGLPSLVRHACADGVASSQVLARNLDVASVTVANGAVASRNGGIVTFRVAVIGQDGTATVFQVSSVQRGNSAGSALPGGGSIPTPPASDPCIVTGTGVSITPSTVARNPDGTLKSAVTIDIQTDGACGLLTADLTGAGGAAPGVTTVVLAQVLPSANPLFEEWSATLDTATTGWSSGTFTVSFQDTGAAITGNPTGTLVVQAACSVSNFTATPYIVGINNGNGKVNSDITLTASGVDPGCGALSVLIAPVINGAAPPVNNIALTGTPNRVGTIASSPSQSWTAGIYKLTLLEAGNPLTPAMSTNIDLGGSNACKIDAVTVTPPTVSLVGGAAAARPLAAAVAINMTQNNPATPCINLKGTITGPTPGIGTLTFTGNAPWTATLPANNQSWAPGDYKISFSADTPLVGVSTGKFTVLGSATKLAFGTQPVDAAAGSALPAFTVEIQDAAGNVTNGTANITIAIATNPGGGTLTGTATAAAVNGVATFTGISINKAGTAYSLIATSPALASATSNPFNITAGPPKKLLIVSQPTNAAGGATISAVTVQILDATDNVTTSTANVTIAIGTNPGSGVLTGTTTVAAVNGLATFNNLSINKTGVGYTLAATSSSLTGATTNAFNITAGPPAKLTWQQQPTNTPAGATIPVAVRIEDAGGNLTASTADITMAIGTNPATGTLAGTKTVTAVNGVATFTDLSINKTGTGYTITAASTGLTSTTSNTFNITPGTATKLTWLQQPTNAVAGAANNPAITIRIEDANGNLTTSTANVTLNFVNNAGTGTLSNATVAAVNGLATFSNLSINKTGTGYTVNATGAGFTSPTSNSFNITPGTASKLTWLQQPSNAVAGAANNPAITVRIEDANGNATTSTANVTISFVNNVGTATLSNASVAAVNGTATFNNLSIDKIGTGYTVNATGAGFTSPTSNSFNITPGTASKLTWLQQPSNAVAGAANNPAITVRIEDANGNLTTSTANITISFVNNAGTATLSNASVAAVNGTATFNNLSINKTGTGYTVNATGAGFTSPTSNTFNITGVPVGIRWISSIPAATCTPAGSGNCSVTGVGNKGTFRSAVVLVDAAGNATVNTGGTFTVTLSVSGGSTDVPSVTIASGSSTSGQFTFTRNSGNGSASVTGTTAVGSVSCSVGA